jgi:hypothetical protein
MSFLHTVIIDKLEEMGCATAGYHVWISISHHKPDVSPHPHQLSSPDLTGSMYQLRFDDMAWLEP